MARLPQPGGDSGNWGTLLNEFLAQAHNPDGNLKNNSVGSSQLQSNAVTATNIANGTIVEGHLAPAVQTKLNSSGGTLTDGAVTNAKLADGAVNANKIADGAVTSLKLAPSIQDSLSSAILPYSPQTLLEKQTISLLFTCRVVRQLQALKILPEDYRLVELQSSLLQMRDYPIRELLRIIQLPQLSCSMQMSLAQN